MCTYMNIICPCLCLWVYIFLWMWPLAPFSEFWRQECRQVGGCGQCGKLWLSPVLVDHFVDSQKLTLTFHWP